MPATTPLKQVLRAEGRKQNWLAAQVGKHETEMSRIVNGFIPDEATQRAIAAALGKTTEELWPVGPQQVAA